MADALVARGDRAFVDEDYQDAVDLYTQALEQSPTDARIYGARAHAHLKLDNFLEAVEDSSKAIELDPQLVRAYLHKGIASFKLEEYETALAAFETGARLAPSNSSFETWKRKCQAEIEEEMGAAEPAPSRPAQPPSSLKEGSPTSVLPPAQPAPPAPPAPAPASTSAAASTSKPAAAAKPLGPAAAGAPQAFSGEGALAPAAPQAFQGKYRHQYYQMQNKVTVDVFAKNLSKDQVSIKFEPQHLTVVITDSPQQAGASSSSGGGAATEGGEYTLDVDLYGPVLPEQCRYEVLKTKVEITMTKANNLQWGSLEKSDRVAAPNYSNPVAAPPAGEYPTSTKAKKDWSKLESEVKELEEKGELSDGDPLNDFFRKIFKQGDEDQRRAMIKSFVESNGTVLSTNWAEVGAKKVECTPPDGMEVRKWDH